MSFGFQETGFNLKTFFDIIKDIEKRYKERFEDNDYTLDFNTPEGIHSEAIAYELKEIWEELLLLSNNISLDTAEGIFLDKLGFLFAINRKNGRKANGQIKIIGEKNTVVAAGQSIFCGDLEYVIKNTVIIEKNDGDVFYGIGFIEAVEAGEQKNIKNIFEEFDFDIQNITKIKNITSIIDGTDEETDAEYRKRIKQRQNIKNETATYSALYNAIIAIDSVKNVIILDSNSDENIQPGAIKIFIEGTPDFEISKAIFEKKADGIITLKDENSIAHTFDKYNQKRTIIYNMISYVVPHIFLDIIEVSKDVIKDITLNEIIINKIKYYINNLHFKENLNYTELYSEIRGLKEIKKIVLKISVFGEKEQTYDLDEEKEFSLNNSKIFRINDESIKIFYKDEVKDDDRRINTTSYF